MDERAGGWKCSAYENVCRRKSEIAREAIEKSGDATSTQRDGAACQGCNLPPEFG